MWWQELYAKLYVQSPLVYDEAVTFTFYNINITGIPTTLESNALWTN